MRQAFAPVGTRLRRAAATEDGGEGALNDLAQPGRQPGCVMRQAFAPVGTRLRRAAATEDGGEGVF